MIRKPSEDARTALHVLDECRKRGIEPSRIQCGSVAIEVRSWPLVPDTTEPTTEPEREESELPWRLPGQVYGQQKKPTIADEEE